jgi:hypothetical protein
MCEQALAPEPPLRLIVTTGPKSNSFLEISPNATLEELKSAVEAQSGVASAQQRLRCTACKTPLEPPPPRATRPCAELHTTPRHCVAQACKVFFRPLSVGNAWGLMIGAQRGRCSVPLHTLLPTYLLRSPSQPTPCHLLTGPPRPPHPVSLPHPQDWRKRTGVSGGHPEGTGCG